MLVEWKQPRLKLVPQTYGEYLISHPDIMPEKISLDTKGYRVQKTEYGTAKELELPFKEGDWIDETYVSENFRMISDD